MKTLVVSIAVAILAAAPAQSRPADDGSYSASVRSGDLNLASAGGLATFRGRVKAVANRVCGTAPVLPFNDAKAIGQCRAQLYRSADRQVAFAMAKSDTIVAGTR